MIKRLLDDIEDIANAHWQLALTKGTKIGNYTKGFKSVCIMDEHRFKDFVRELLTVGINAGIEEAMRSDKAQVKKHVK